MLDEKIKEFISNTLSFKERIEKAQSLFLDLKINKITKKDISEDNLIALINSFIKQNTPQNYKNDLQYYLIYLLSSVLDDILNSPIDEEEKNEVVEDNVEPKDWTYIPPEQRLDLKPEEMAPIEDDIEFLKKLGKTHPHEQC